MYSPENNRERIVSRLEELRDDASFEAAEWSEEAMKTLVDMASRGKMIRGSLLIDAYDSMEGEDDIVEYAAAIELIHTSLLIHDDIVDRDEVRRGEEALHVRYRSEDISDREARNLAMCAGDIAYFLAFKIISESDLQSGEALSLLSSTFARIGLGEMSDIELSIEDSDRDRIVQMYRDKTASYTFALPLRLAAVLSEGEDMELLEDIGLELGVLYQIKDDHLDLFSDSSDTGKPSGSDLVEGKPTLHTELLLEKGGPEARSRLVEAGEEDVEELIGLMKDLSVKDDVEAELKRRSEDVEESIGRLQNPDLRDLLEQVVSLVVGREK